MLPLAAIGLTSCLIAFPGPLTTTAQEATEARRQDPAEALTALQHEFDEAQEAFYKLYQEAKDDTAREALMSKYPNPAKYAQEAFAIAESAPKTETAEKALVWAANQSQGDSIADRCFELLSKNHLESESLGDVAMTAQYNGSPAAQEFLEKIAKDSPHATVRGKAKFSLANVLKKESERAGEGSGAAKQRALDLLNECIEEYSGVDLFRSKLGAKAKSLIFAMENLAVGLPCPEITGTDADGAEFKLSDYRGKVVFLDFWGYW